MGDLLVAWVAAPALLLGLCTGLGLGVSRLARGALPGAVVPLAGLGAATALGALLAGLAHDLIVPGLAALALAGAIWGRPWGRPDGSAVVALAGAFALYAAPIVLSGEATFAGYIKLDDTATWLALTDRVMDAGTSAAGLPPSTYEAVVSINLGNGYPVGGFLPLGFASELSGVDPAWLFQPYVGLVGALLALALWELARAAVPARPARALAAVVASCSALLVGYYLWGGLKELLTAALAAGFVATVFARPARGARDLVAPAVLAGGLVASASLAGRVWVLPAAGAAAWRYPWRDSKGGRLAAPGLVAAVAGVAAVAAAGAGLSPFRGSFTNQGDLGNLAEPLEPAQLAGIWPASDLRFDPASDWLAYALVALAVVCAVWGAGVAVRRRDTGLAVYALGSVAVCAAVAAFASPWLDAKAFAIASPAVLLVALAGAVALGREGGLPRAAPVACVALLAAGVGWSLVTQWGGANLAPRAQLEELEDLGERLAGGGPTLMTEYQPYGVRHFLRDAQPEGVSELRRRELPLVGGGTAAKGRWVDTDRLAAGALAPYEALVLRRTPEQSRPPPAYRRTWSGRYYELWEREEGAPSPLAHLPLGEGRSPIGSPDCAAVAALARRVPGGELVAGSAPEAVVLPPPGGRFAAAGEELEVWLRGSVRGLGTLELDGEVVATRRHELSGDGLYTSFGELDPVHGGRHELRIELGGADLHPGSAPVPAVPAPILLRSEPPADALRRVRAADADLLCGKRWDWIEAFPAR